MNKISSFENYNPIALLVYFLTVTAAAMLCYNPVIIVLSFFGALTFYITLTGMQGGKIHAFFLLSIPVSAFINPIFNHSGMTVLFIMNNNPVTAEAVFYGTILGFMIAAVLYWFSCFSHIMTSDKLLYLFSRISPKLALLLSMSLRYIPLFAKQAADVNNAQKALGIYRDNSIPDAIRAKLRVFSVMVTWSLENGIITADSMTSRGYGIGKRTRFSLFSFKKRDAMLLCTSVLLFIPFCASLITGAITFEFYPVISPPKNSFITISTYIAYAVSVFLPTIHEIKEGFKWKYLKSKI